MVKWEEESRKQASEDTMMAMKPIDLFEGHQRIGDGHGMGQQTHRDDQVNAPPDFGNRRVLLHVCVLALHCSCSINLCLVFDYVEC
jgi:hypothetical protein